MYVAVCFTNYVVLLSICVSALILIQLLFLNAPLGLIAWWWGAVTLLVHTHFLYVSLRGQRQTSPHNLSHFPPPPDDFFLLFQSLPCPVLQRLSVIPSEHDSALEHALRLAAEQPGD